VGFLLLVCFYLYKLDEKKVAIGYPFAPDEVSWNFKNLTLFPLLAFVAGIVAGLLGIGGGILQAPLMLELGLIPWVTSSTSQFIVLVTSISGVVQTVANGDLEWRWALWFSGFNCIGGFVGQQGVARIVDYFKIQSLIVFFLAGTIVITTVALTYSGVARVTAGSSGWGFKQYCHPVNYTNHTNSTNFTNHTVWMF